MGYTPYEDMANRNNNGFRVEWEVDSVSSESSSETEDDTSDVRSRDTNLVAMAWYGKNFDPEATVVEL